MDLAFRMIKMAKEGYSRAARVESQYLINNPHASVQDVKMQVVGFPVDKQVMDA